MLQLSGVQKTAKGMAAGLQRAGCFAGSLATLLLCRLRVRALARHATH